MSSPSRVESARRSVRITRYAIGVVAAGAFAGGAVVARAAHPGTHGHHSTAATAQAAIPSESSALQAAAGSSSSSSSSSSGSVSPAPETSPPVVQSSGS